MQAEDKFKEAACNFLIAADIFAKIRLESKGLKKDEFTLDLSEANLQICQYIMRGQAQYCSFEKVKRNAPNKYSLLAQLAMQGSVFYAKAYDLILSSCMSKITVLTNFLPVIYFNEYVFKAQANFWMSQHFLGEMNKPKIGIGQAIGYLSAACEALEKIKKDNVKLSQPMKVQYDTLVKTYEERKNCIKGLNDRMYHEAIPAELDRIECKLFTQAFSLDEWLNRPFEGIDILSGLVPSAVQDLERE